MEKDWKAKLPLLAGPTVAVGLSLAFGLGWLLPNPTSRTWGYLLMSGLTLLLLALELLLALWKPTWEKIRIALSPLWLLVAAIGWMALIDSLTGRLAVVIGTALIIGSYQAHLLAKPEEKDRQASTESDRAIALAEAAAADISSVPAMPSTPMNSFLALRPGLPRAGFITDLFAAFLFMATVFGIEGFYNVPIPVSALLIGLVWGRLAHESFWRFGADRDDCRLIGWAFGVFGAQAHIGLSFLPVGHLTDTAVAVLMLAFCLDLARQALFGTVEPKKYRGEALLGLALIILLLVTAKWV